MESASRLQGLLASRWALRCGVLLMALAAVWSLRIGVEGKALVPTTGSYVDLIPRIDPDGTGMVPVVSFETTDGQVVRFETDVESAHYRLPTEEAVSVWYDPSDPGSATVDNPSSRQVAPAAVALVGAGFLVGSITVHRRARSASE